MPENEFRDVQGADGAGGGQRGAEWPLRDRELVHPTAALDEMLSYVHNPDMIGTATVLWAHDMILELVGLVRGFEAATAILRDLGPIPAHEPSDSSAVWRTGRSVDPRVTVYKHDRIAGLMLTEDLAAEVAAAGNAVTLDETDVVHEVVDALLEVGPWSEIDGDGSPGSVLADHIRQLTYVSETEG